MTILKSINGIVTLIWILTIPAHVSARNHYTPDGVDLNIVSDYRGSLRKFSVATNRAHVEKDYVIAKDDESYRIRVRNRSGERVGVVIAVDGRNIISGKKSYLKPHERMYILEPYQTAEFEGWRTGRNQTNKFYFTDSNSSYAADWGDKTAMGVIALAVFNEQRSKVNQQYNYGQTRRLNKSFKSSRRERGAGTGFGEAHWSPSREVPFVATHKAIQKKFIKYEYRSTLCQKGIVQCKQQQRKNRFWRENDDDYGYVPFPSWCFEKSFR
jgi:hypothetical protein